MRENNSIVAGGILPRQYLIKLWQEGAIWADLSLEEAQFQPASIDLRLGKRLSRLRASFLPLQKQGALNEPSGPLAGVPGWELYHEELDEERGRVLEPGQVYLVELEERLDLPPEISGIANPKSSTGRLDIFTRLITETGAGFDRVPAGYKGKLYLEIFSRTFTVLIRRGICLNQLRLIQGRFEPVSPARLNQELVWVDDRPLFPEAFATSDPERGDALELTVGLSGKRGDVVGYRARRHAPLLDLSKERAHPVEDYWEPIRFSGVPALVLEPEEFYLLISRERVVIPPGLAAEMSPYEARIGELRTHYAGFFDPGFGYLPGRAVMGTHAVLEVRAHDVPFLICHGQPVCRLSLYPMLESPDVHYGEEIGSHYAHQHLALSKHFISD